MHKSVATKSSTFFDRAFNGNFDEGNTQSMRLEDVEIPIFSMLLHWMYFHEIEDKNEEDVMGLAKLWVLGGRFLVPEVQNAAMALILDTIPGLYDDKIKELVIFASESQRRYPLRKLAIDLLSWGRIYGDFETWGKDLSAEILLELAANLRGCMPWEVEYNGRYLLSSVTRYEVPT